ncbi:diguanylate cyclase domain-containing protein [Benzoatithermus flavus]|uniref:Sensor domain-containing diguanylate cyclase n=1 Tax=Benzoatithermus flavus TaxID=3108223 RepID=A0ABU8XR82_9PROT
MLHPILAAIAAPVAALGRGPAGGLVVEAVNEPLAHLLGCAPDDLVGSSLERILPTLATVSPGSEEEVTLGPEALPYRAVVRAMPDALSEQSLLLVTFVRDDTAERRLRRALAAAELGIWESDIATGRVRFDPICLTRLGRDPGDGARDLPELVELIHPHDRIRVRDLYEQCCQGERPQMWLEYRVRRRDGTYAWIEERATVAERAADGRPARIVGLSADITARKEAELRLEHLALHDPLTGLPNRRALAEALDHAIARARRTGQPVAVLVLDLDGFKAVNDRHGHPAGDAALVEVADRLRRTVRRSDIVARLGGDEFAVVAGELKGPAPVLRLARRIVAALTTPMRLEAAEVPIGVSIGVAFFPGDGETPEDVLGHADRALYAAKRDRAGWRFTAELPAD